MRNKNSEDELVNYDDVKQLRKNALMILLIIVAGFVILFQIVRFNEIKDLKQDIADAKTEKKDVQKYNKGIQEKQQKQLDEVGLTNVKEEMSNFNNLFFEWSTWGEFSRNMKELRALYPKIQSGDVVNISGKSVGTGESPESTYDNDFMTTTNREELAEVVNQNKDFNDGQSDTMWYIIGEKKGDSTFNITHMNHYREINPN